MKQSNNNPSFPDPRVCRGAAGVNGSSPPTDRSGGHPETKESGPERLGFFCLDDWTNARPPAILVSWLQVHFMEGKTRFHGFFMSIVPARGPQASREPRRCFPVGPCAVPTGKKTPRKFTRRSLNWTYGQTRALRRPKADGGGPGVFPR